MSRMYCTPKAPNSIESVIAHNWCNMPSLNTHKLRFLKKPLKNTESQQFNGATGKWRRTHSFGMPYFIESVFSAARTTTCKAIEGHNEKIVAYLNSSSKEIEASCKSPNWWLCLVYTVLQLGYTQRKSGIRW